MRAWVLRQQGSLNPGRLILEEVSRVALLPGEIRLRIEACALCRTDLHIVEGDIPARRLPLILGHQAVGRVIEVGEGSAGWSPGDRAGVPWLGGVDGSCPFCLSQRENLCPEGRFTGYDRDGGYAEEIVALASFSHRVPEGMDALLAAPLLCGGAIGYRAFRLAHLCPGEPVALYGFGSSAHLVLQLAVALGHPTCVRSRGQERLDLAKRLGATWAGDYRAKMPLAVAAGLIFAPAGGIVPRALGDLQPGGRLVLAGIHMSDIPTFPYALIYQERSIQSVANSTRADVSGFIALAEKYGIVPEAEAVPFEALPEALDRLKSGRMAGTMVLQGPTRT
jgi:propanol-preferring alcohol dehydrogenase